MMESREIKTGRGIEMINASAGSGKTFSLTARILDEIQAGLAPEALMATTFTNKAAAELLERIRVRLIENGRHEEAIRIPDGFIGTVNSVCGRLLTEYALDAGLSPALAVMPEEDSEDIFRVSVDRVIRSHAGELEPAATRLEYNKNAGMYGSGSDWRRDVKTIVDRARANRMDAAMLKQFGEDSWQSLQDALGKPVPLDLEADLLEALDSAMEGLKGLGSEKKNTQAALSKLSEIQKKFRDGEGTWPDWVKLGNVKPEKAGETCMTDLWTAASKLHHCAGFQTDLETLIKGVFGCAGEVLSAYGEYKKEQGLMDFVDQETMTLDLAKESPAFRQSLSDRIALLMVDEFQDTSPIQLALFLALHDLSGKSVWVGDPKQAIYGFRGTDPKLMEEVLERIPSGRVLDKSWRSREALVAFTNKIFCHVFHAMGKDRVCLEIPKAREEKARGGTLETWRLKANNKDEEAQSIAAGIEEFLGKNPATKPGEVAVLCRTNSGCEKIAEKLVARGIRASVGQGNLLDTREARLALAALRYMNDSEDSLALAEMVSLTGDGGWFPQLMKDPAAAIGGWEGRKDLSDLALMKTHIRHLTPLEALEEAISGVGLTRWVKQTNHPARAMANLDALRKACVGYMDLCASRRSAATVDGFIAHMLEAETKQAEGTDGDTVQVLTYHRSKGLEWPWVILTELDKAPESSPFGIEVMEAPDFDLGKPLAGRSIHYWPWPFGGNKKYPPLEDAFEALPLSGKLRDKAVRETQRLLYVGMTRAKDGLVMALRTGKDGLGTGMLDALQGKDGTPLMVFGEDKGNPFLAISGEKTEMIFSEHSGEDPRSAMERAAAMEYAPELPAAAETHVPARISPSGFASEFDESENEEDKGTGDSWEEIKDFGARMQRPDHVDKAEFGSAVHDFLAVDKAGDRREQRETLAASIAGNHGLKDILDPGEMARMAENFQGFIKERYPEGVSLREWPMTLRNDENQLMHGWIDWMVELPEGYVIIDHKTYAGEDAKAHMDKYIFQLDSYKAAVELAAGKPVLERLIHLPVLGRILKLKET